MDNLNTMKVKILSICLMRFTVIVLFVFGLFSYKNLLFANDSTKCTWTSDNENGTYTNPLFYEEFSDPDLIRVGDDYYMTGTTMHAMPGLPVLLPITAHIGQCIEWNCPMVERTRLDVFITGNREIIIPCAAAPCLKQARHIR